MPGFDERLLNTYASLSKSHKAIAVYLINNLDEAVFLTALQIARKVQVSETSVIRLAYKLGYDSFSQMHREMQKCILTKDKMVQHNFLEAFNIEKIVENFSKIHATYLRKLFENINYSELEHICSLLMSKKRVVIMGFQDSYGLAFEFANLLSKIRENVTMYHWALEDPGYLDTNAGETALVVISLSPHTPYTIEHIRIFKNLHCTVIDITDKKISQTTDLSEWSIQIEVPRDGQNNIINTAHVISFFNYLFKIMEDSSIDALFGEKCIQYP